MTEQIQKDMTLLEQEKQKFKAILEQAEIESDYIKSMADAFEENPELWNEELSGMSDAEQKIYINHLAELTGHITDDMPPEQKARILKENEEREERRRGLDLPIDEAIKYYAKLGEQEDAQKQRQSSMYQLGKFVRALCKEIITPALYVMAALYIILRLAGYN